jgi:hypothetical protein
MAFAAADQPPGHPSAVSAVLLGAGEKMLGKIVHGEVGACGAW